jgi:ATP-binding cassette subfamily B protein
METRMASPRRPEPKEKKKPTFRENLRALRNLPGLFKLIWETSKSLTVATVVLRLLRALLPLATLWVAKLILDEVVTLIRQPEPRDYTALWIWVGVELAIVVSSDVLARLTDLNDALLGDKFANQTSVRIMEQASRMDLAQFEDPNFYDKLERARQQTTPRVMLMTSTLAQVQDVITILFLGVGMAWFNPWLILLIAIAVVPAFLGESYFNRTGYSLSVSWTPQRRELDYLRYIGASDETAKEVKLFGLNEFLTGRFRKVSGEYYEANAKLAKRRAFWGSVLNLGGTLAYYAAYVVILITAVKGIITLGVLTFLAGSFARMRQLLQGVLSRFSSIAQGALYLKDYFEFMEIQPTIISKPGSIPFPSPIREGFTFENVGFQYPGSENWAVRGLSFHLKPGEKLALVGENGSGKTTLTKLISRLYDPSEGRILLDGVDLRQYDLNDLRAHTGVIFQDFVKYQMRFSENIATGRIQEEGRQEKIESAAVMSLADTVAAKLPDKYDQMLGRRFSDGVELSGGEWQKIALARAYMRDASVLILDEPTAALDARAEYEVFKRFSDLTSGKTAIIISHRFSTVRMANRILILRKGELAEIGTHEELLAMKGLYAELFHLQAAGYQ